MVRKSFAALLAVTILPLFCGISSTLAADLPVKAPPIVILPGWTGFYFGANGGGSQGHERFYDIFGPVPDFALDADAHNKGGIGGFQLGYRYQFNWLVLGLQGDFDWAGIRSNFSCFSFGNQTCSANAEWIATVTGRAGIAVGPALLYVDAGPAWMRYTVSNIAGSAACVPVGGGAGVCSAPGDLFEGGQITPGWTVGAGVEYMLSPNWSLFLQYSFMNFGEHPVVLFDGGTGVFPEEIKQSFQVAQFGVNYRLTGPSGAGATWSVPGLFSADSGDDTGKKIRAFSFFDVAKYSVDGGIGSLFAFSKDLDTSGPRVWILGGAGAYQFFDNAGNRIKGVYSTGDLLGGYAFEGENYEINLLAGGSVENDMLSAFDAGDPVKGTALGFKVREDIYFNPTPTSVFATEGEYSTAFKTYWTSATYGYDIFNKGFFLGPEVVALGNERADQWRVGTRLTGLRAGKFSVDLSAGFAHDSVVGDGAYGHLEMSTSF